MTVGDAFWNEALASNRELAVAKIHAVLVEFRNVIRAGLVEVALSGERR